MTEVATRELRNNTAALLRRVEAGEEIVITVGGRRVALLTPLGTQPRWVSRDDFVRRFATTQADASLRKDLEELASETTDDLPPL